ncbi:MAG: hypothetical protein ACP6IU_10865 [Candidatus Asgardarchaeia archaeon]
MALLEEINALKKKISLREWLLNELKKYEKKYGMSTASFVKKWRSGSIPEPEKHELLEEFLDWDALAESLEKVEHELKEIEKRIKES